ncbi:uncharacterized protein LOC135704587 [Ochlerotatus camptorhynchus]|uniref:uncharacterized protein LOC135704587 n=1 Tax=Ochlerotatus camptorhynchus TaxID=644619 RepID=UPI0031D8FAE8
MAHITRRQFFLFQGVAIGVLTIINTMTTIYVHIANPDSIDNWHYYKDIHGLWEVIIPRELCWAIAAGVLLYGIYRQDIRFSYPIIVVAFGVMAVQLVREIMLFWSNSFEEFWYYTQFFNPVMMIWMTCRSIHGMMTLIALKHLFESEQSADNNFVRFNVESAECEVESAEVSFN